MTNLSSKSNKTEQNNYKRNLTSLFLLWQRKPLIQGQAWWVLNEVLIREAPHQGPVVLTLLYYITIYNLPLITGAFLNIFKWLETYHSLSEFLLNEIERHAFSLQRYSILYPLFVINLFQPNALQALKLVHTVTWSPDANYRRDLGRADRGQREKRNGMGFSSSRCSLAKKAPLRL